MIVLKRYTTYHGPNPYAPLPVVVIDLDVSALDISAAAIAIKKISKLSESWHTVEPLNSMVTIQFILDFVASWARAALSEVRGHLCFAQVHYDDSQSFIVLEFHEPSLSVHAVALAAYLIKIEGSLSRKIFDDKMSSFWKLCQAMHPDFQAQFLLDYARTARIPAFQLLGNGKYWQFGWGANSKVFFESSSIEDSAIGRDLSANKLSSLLVLRSLGLPVAPSKLVNSPDELLDSVSCVGYPCVVKPLDKGRSIGVTVGIDSFAQLQAAFHEVRKFSRKPVLLEGHIAGDVHRIIVIRGRVWKVIRRELPCVTGDGNTSLMQLVNLYNKMIECKCRPGAFVGPVPLDNDFRQCIAREGLSAGDIPAAGQKVRLQSIPLLKRGAQYVDVTQCISAETKAACELIAQTFSIVSCGIDFISEDIAMSCYEQGVFLELNTTPGLNVPFMAGVKREEIGRMLLGDACSRLPTLLIVSENYSSDYFIELLSRNASLGWICGSMAGVGRFIIKGPNSNLHETLNSIVVNRNVTSLLVITDIAALSESGLPFDKADTAIIFRQSIRLEEWLNLIRRHSARVLHIDNFASVQEEIEFFLAKPTPGLGDLVNGTIIS